MKVNIFTIAKTDKNISMDIYAHQLIKHLKNISDCQVKTITIKGRRIIFFKDFFLKDLFYPLYARFNQGDINHLIDHSYGALAYLLDPRRTVVTCHDLNPLEFIPQSSWLGRKRFLYNIKGMLKANNIIAVSKSTKENILKHFDYKGNIFVIYSGIDSAFKKLGDIQVKIRQELGLKTDYKYLLHVGSSNPVKNIDIILRVLSNLQNYCLVKVGSFTAEQIKMIRRLKLFNKIIHFDYLPQIKLAKIYNAVDVLVFPSFCEGFGWPVLETMACGCPVICSNAISLKEIGGDAPFYIDPYSDLELQNAIVRVLNDETLRNSMIEKGLNQAAKFDWETSVRETHAVYEKILIALK